MNANDTFDDPEDTQHTAAERALAASRSTWVSVGVNLVLTIVQIWVGVFAKSQGLIADGIHSLSDLVADFVVLFANHTAKKTPTLTTLTATTGLKQLRHCFLAPCCLQWALACFGRPFVNWNHQRQSSKYTSWPCMLPLERCWRRSCCFATCCRWPSALDQACWWPMPGMRAQMLHRR